MLIAAQDSLDDTVVLKECETIDLSEITTATDYINAANSSDALSKIEELIGIWMKQIEQVNSAQFSLRILVGESDKSQ